MKKQTVALLLKHVIFSIWSIEKIDYIKFIIKKIDYFLKNGVFVVALFVKIKYNSIVKKYLAKKVEI